MAAPLAAAANAQRPNVIIVLVDDQGFGDLSIHGNTVLQTPNLDSIAKDGVQFTQFHVNPVCSPTRSSILTGRYYYRTGIVDTFLGRSMMYPDEITLAEMLKGSGYRTGIFGKWHLGDHYTMRPMDQGFDESLIHEGGGIAQPSDPPDGNSYFNPKLLHNGKRVQRQGYCTDVFFSEAMRFIEAHRTRPFFVYLTPNAPHTPLQVDESYVAPFRGKGVDETTAKVYGMVKNVDENAGRLLAHLDKLGLAENTLLIYMTDNGPQQTRYNAGMRGLKGTVYEGGIRVPCFVRWPAVVKAGGQVDRLAAHIDIFPTVLDICGVARPKGVKIDGTSLYSLMKDPSSAPKWPDRTVYFQWHRGDRGELFRACAARSQRYKLVDGKALYDLQSDPAESKDIASANPELVAKMRAGYEAWFQDVASTRNFEPPRIPLGTAAENPVLLTRQDWRGPRAGWEADSLGYWEVEVTQAGAYEVELLFPATKSAGSVRLTLGGASGSAEVAAGSSKATIQLSAVRKGPARVEPVLELGGATFGVHYANVKRM